MKDTVCECSHWFEEHGPDGSCGAPECPCVAFAYSAEFNTPEDIADRGGEHARGCGCAFHQKYPEEMLRR